MKKKPYKKIAIALFVIVFAVVGSITIKTIAFPASPLSNTMTLEELQKMEIQVGYVETSETWTDEVYDAYYNNQIEGSKEAGCILIAIPTGNLYFNRGTILQEVLVEQVIRGTCKYEKIWLQNGLRSTLVYEDEHVTLKGMDRSFMQEDCKYLLFCDSLATNKYSDRKVYTETDAMWFGCYNLTRDCAIVMGENENTYRSEIEFYTSSEKNMQYYNEAKRALIEMYCGKL